MGAFFAKARWDLSVNDVDRRMLVELAGLPTINDEFHTIIMCGRRYTRKVCNELNGGNKLV